MMARTAAAFALTGLALFASPEARASDSIFGSFFSRATTPADAPVRGENSLAQDRERQSREMRRAYWERERNRMSQTATARGTGSETVTIR